MRPAGSCLSYGHSCWGAHGKRTGPPGRTASSDGPGAMQFQPQQLLDQPNPLPAALTGAERWALNAYYSFNKLLYPPPALASTAYVYSNVLGASGSSKFGTESSNSAEGRFVDTSNEMKNQGSTEQNLLLGDDRLMMAVEPANQRRKDRGHKKKLQSSAANHRYPGADDSFEDNTNIGRILPSYEDVGQVLLLNAASAASSTLSDNDASVASTRFNRKLFTDNNKNSILLNA
uniref:Uncharacterized protein n=1 Tax=Anopheles christyi TaxID=43041 RepID=A0A182K1C4_9DIPT